MFDMYVSTLLSSIVIPSTISSIGECYGLLLYLNNESNSNNKINLIKNILITIKID